MTQAKLFVECDRCGELIGFTAPVWLTQSDGEMVSLCQSCYRG